MLNQNIWPTLKKLWDKKFASRAAGVGIICDTILLWAVSSKFSNGTKSTRFFFVFSNKILQKNNQESKDGCLIDQNQQGFNQLLKTTKWKFIFWRAISKIKN